MISQRLRSAVKKSGLRQYRLAHGIGVHHSTLSCWLNGISAVETGDPRVLRLGALLGVPAAECFDFAESMETVEDADSSKIQLAQPSHSSTVGTQRPVTPRVKTRQSR